MTDVNSGARDSKERERTTINNVNTTTIYASWIEVGMRRKEDSGTEEMHDRWIE